MDTILFLTELCVYFLYKEKLLHLISVSGLSCRKCDTHHSYIDDVITSFPMESPKPFCYFHPFHWNIYICYELNEFLWLFILFPVFFWWTYNTTPFAICQYIFTFYFIIFCYIIILFALISQYLCLLYNFQIFHSRHSHRFNRNTKSKSLPHTPHHCETPAGK